MNTLVLFVFYLFLDLVRLIYPVAIFHSQSTTCLDMQETVTYIKNELSNLVNEKVHVECIESGNKTLFSSILNQSEKACELILSNKHFQDDFSIVGFSQGALIGRYIIQICGIKGKVRRFISIGGPMMGIGKIPECWFGAACYFIQRAIAYLVYNQNIQNNIGPAGYFRIPDNQNVYVRKANFLPVLNNERVPLNTTIYSKFAELEQLVLIKFLNDTKIFPKESAWFEFVDEQENVIELEKSDIYKRYCLPFENLINRGAFIKIEIEGDNCEMNKEHIDKNVISYLK